MYLKINKRKKLEIKELTKFKDRFFTLQFVFDPIDYVVKIPKKRKTHTYFFFQKVDVLMTDKEEKIIWMMESIKTESKIRRRKNGFNIYFLPLGSVDNFKIGDKLQFTEEDTKTKNRT